MIKVHDYSLKYKKQYLDLVWKEISSRIKKNKTDFKRFFEDSFVGDEINTAFFKDILIKPIPEVKRQYNCVKEYFDFAFIVSLDIKWILKKGEYSEKGERVKLRRKYLFECGAFDSNTFLGQAFKNYLDGKKLDKESVLLSDTAFEKCCKELRTVYDTSFGFLKNIFDYSILEKDDKYKLISDLEIEVCPYCNRQYISVGKSSRDEIVIADIDHFYPKSSFYLFSLSLYNFVPSCKICNSLFKNKWQVDLPYPYEEKYGQDVWFCLKSNGRNQEIIETNSLLGWDENLEIGLCYNDNAPNIDKLKREVQLFKIEEVYAIHKNFAISLKYKKTMIESLLINWFENNGQEDFPISLEEAKMYLYGMDVYNIKETKQPLGKLTKDILDSLDVV